MKSNIQCCIADLVVLKIFSALRRQLQATARRALSARLQVMHPHWLMNNSLRL